MAMIASLEAGTLASAVQYLTSTARWASPNGLSVH